MSIKKIVKSVRKNVYFSWTKEFGFSPMIEDRKYFHINKNIETTIYNNLVFFAEKNGYTVHDKCPESSIEEFLFKIKGELYKDFAFSSFSEYSIQPNFVTPGAVGIIYFNYKRICLSESLENKKDPIGRQSKLMTLAHELGHLVARKLYGPKPGKEEILADLIAIGILLNVCSVTELQYLYGYIKIILEGFIKKNKFIRIDEKYSEIIYPENTQSAQKLLNRLEEVVNIDPLHTREGYYAYA